MQEINESVVKAKQGDMQSMDNILNYFKPKVVAICREYFLIGADFDDILQEGMIGLYKAILGYEQDKNENFSSFASLCIHRHVQNAVRRATSKKNQPLNDYLSINIEGGVGDEENSIKILLKAKDKGAEQISLDREQNKLFYNKIKDELSGVQYQVLLMYLNGYAYNEIATKLDLNTKRVDNQIQQIKKKLKRLLKGE